MENEVWGAFIFFFLLEEENDQKTGKMGKAKHICK